MSCSRVFAQHELSEFQHVSRDQGLSQGTVMCLLQDREGYLWFGTQGGLNRYDGYEFKVYYYDQQNPASLSSNFIMSLCEDPSGALWVGTNGDGLNRLDRRTGKFDHFFADPKNPNSLSDNQISSLLVDHQGKLWVGTLGGGLNCFDPVTGRFSRFLHDGADPYSLSSNRVSSMCESPAGVLWIGTLGGGLNRLDVAKETFTVYRHQQNSANPEPGTRNPEPLLGSDRVMVVFVDRAGMLWLGTEDSGLDRLDPRTNQITHFRNDPQSPTSLGGNDVRTIFEDREGVLWVGTRGGGLSQFDRGSGKFTQYRNDPFQPGSLSSNSVLSLIQDRAGVLWVGTGDGGANRLDRSKHFLGFRENPGQPAGLRGKSVQAFAEDPTGAIWVGTDGGGVNRLDSIEAGVFSHFQNNPQNPFSLGSNRVTSLARDLDGTFWVATLGSGLNWLDPQTGTCKRFQHRPEDPTSISNNRIWSVLVDRQGQVWVGTESGLDRLDRATGTFTRFQEKAAETGRPVEDNINVLYEDRAGVVWIGTYGNGLLRLDPTTKEVTRYLSAAWNATSLGSNTVFTIYESTAGALWVGTNGGGLSCLDRTTGTFTSYTIRDGLPSNSVMSMLEDEAGNLWLGTTLGLCRFHPPSRSCRNYDSRDGLQSNEFTQNAALKTSRGEMLFGGINGFNWFHPEKIEDRQFIPALSLTSFLIYGRELEGFNGKDLPPLDYTQNFITFKFAFLNDTVPEKNRYQYKLEGFDRDWVLSGSQRYASYTDLKPGTYVFRVKGANSDGVWDQQGIALRFEVIPPPWKTWWAYSLYVVGIVGGSWLGVQLRLRSLKRRAIILEQSVIERTQEVVQQKNELSHQNEQIIRQRDEIERKSAELERRSREIQEKNSQIIDSILYAERIQQAILAYRKRIGQSLSEYFILFRPKDIVSGDFYWFHYVDGISIIAVVDCTGHGVPGAFMSMIGNSLLSQIVIENQVHDPAQILELMHVGIRKALKQDADDAESQDGMDVAVCRIDPLQHTIIFAGAKRPLYYINGGGELIEVKGDRKSVGGKQKETQRKFTNQTIPIQKEVTVYLASDGFSDQAGETSRKFGTRRFKELLQSTSGYSLEVQYHALIEELEAHQGTEPQRDDITVVGVRVQAERNYSPEGYLM
ncbi:MAG TPA: two-component regulator propeller domain-containing protein [Acidobacteriota bacterium]|nr:two-component regulator propeller domain-containing protein [Acidobacteriota bacterium]